MHNEYGKNKLTIVEKSAIIVMFWVAFTVAIVLGIVPQVAMKWYAFGPFDQYASYFHVMFLGFLAAMVFLTLSIFNVQKKLARITTIITWIALIIGSLGVIVGFHANNDLMWSSLAHSAAEIPFVIGFILFGIAALLVLIGLIHKEYKTRFSAPTILLSFIIITMFFMAYQGLIFGDDITGGCHSHSIASLLIVGIVGLTMQKFGFNNLHGKKKALGLFGLALLYLGIVTAVYLYTLASYFGATPLPFGDQGYPGPPVLFSFGPNDLNGIAMDDMATFVAGIGAFLIGFALIAQLKGKFKNIGTMIKTDIAKFALPFAFLWTVLGLVVPGFGIIEVNESYYSVVNAGIAVDNSFAHWHLMFLFSMTGITLMYLIYEILLPHGKVGNINLARTTEIGNKLMFIGYIIAPFLWYPYTFSLNSAYIPITLIPMIVLGVGAVISAISEIVFVLRKRSD